MTAPDDDPIGNHFGEFFEAGADEALAWEDPDWTLFDDVLSPAPTLPLGVFGRWADWVRCLAASKCAPPDYAAIGLLVAAAACVGGARAVSAWAAWTEPSALWALMVGNPSSSKSPVFSTFVDALLEVEAEENRDFEERRRRWETDKKKAAKARADWEAQVANAQDLGLEPPIKPALADEPQPPKTRRLVTSDATTEALAAQFKSNPKGLILARDELAAWIGNFGKYGGDGEAAYYLERFRGEPLVIDRKLDGHTRVPRALLSVLGGIPPERVTQALLKRIDDGLVSRFLFAFPDPVPRVKPTQTADLGALRDALLRLRSLKFVHGSGVDPVPRIIPLTADAVERAFLPWWQKNGEEADAASGFLAGSLGKGPGVVLRLALALELLDWAANGRDAEPEAVGETAMRGAITLFEDYFAPMAARVFGGQGRSQADLAARALLRYVHRERVEVVNVRAVSRLKMHGLAASPYVKNALETLRKAGWCRPLVTPGRVDKPGRRRDDWEVNPLLVSSCGPARPY